MKKEPRFVVFRFGKLSQKLRNFGERTSPVFLRRIIEHFPARDGRLRRITANDKTLTKHNSDRRLKTKLDKAGSSRFDFAQFVQYQNARQDLRGTDMQSNSLPRARRTIGAFQNFDLRVKRLRRTEHT